MTEKRFFCDRCHSIILDDRTALDVRSGPLLAHTRSIDLCPDCLAMLRNWLRSAGPGSVPALVSGGATR